MLFTWLICLSFQGTFLMTQAVAKVMVDQGVKNGSIVNLASIVGNLCVVLCSGTKLHCGIPLFCLKVNREFKQ